VFKTFAKFSAVYPNVRRGTRAKSKTQTQETAKTVAISSGHVALLISVGDGGLHSGAGLNGTDAMVREPLATPTAIRVLLSCD
jgi:hypothetical protein